MAAAVARRSQLLLRLLGSRPNPKPLSLSSSSFDAPTAARGRDPESEGDLLSRRLLRLRSPGSVAATIEGWAQMRGGRIWKPELQRALSQLRRARRYDHALQVSASISSSPLPCSGLGSSLGYSSVLFPGRLFTSYCFTFLPLLLSID